MSITTRSEPYLHLRLWETVDGISVSGSTVTAAEGESWTAEIDNRTAGHENQAAGHETNVSTDNAVDDTTGPEFFITAYDTAMTRAGFDFAADSEEFTDEYVVPAIDELREAFLKNDEKALDIYRKAGLDEVKVRWRNFSTARLNWLQRRQIKKIAEMQEILADAQFHFAFLLTVIQKHRPDLREKYSKVEVLYVAGR